MSLIPKSAKAIFDKRIDYQLKTQGSVGLDAINNWGYKDFMYCRVNKNNRVITPLEMSAISPFPPPADGTVFALDFVVDAFQKMNEFYLFNRANHAIRGLDKIKELKRIAAPFG